MNKKAYTDISLFFLTLFVVSAMVALSNAEINLLVTPLSDEPGNVVAVRSNLEGDLFEAQSTVGIGFGSEVEVIKEAVTVTGGGQGNPFKGNTANRPIKPGSFEWKFMINAIPVDIYDLGDGTLDDPAGFVTIGSVNYTSGAFSAVFSAQMTSTTGNDVNYTTYELDVTPAVGVTVSGSGVLITTITVPQVDNGVYPITAIDEAGNIGTVNFQVIPEPLTIGAIVVLSSTAMLVSFYWLRKRSLPKV